MAANFPLSVKRFTAKRNLLDDVDASHINDMQDEITALESTLGANPQIDDTALDPAWTWATIKDRLGYMIRGRHHPYFHAYYPAYRTLSTDVDTLAPFAAPASLYDTHKLYSANGIKIKRPGYYLVIASAFFKATSLAGNPVLRVKGASGGDLASVDWPDFSGTTEKHYEGKWLRLPFMTYAAAGATLKAYTNYGTNVMPNGKYSVGAISLQATHLRDV